MGLKSSLTKLDRVPGWSFLGILLAVIFGALSIYTEFFKVSAPRLEFELLSNSPVLDVREKLPELEVLYRSEDIANSGKTLSVLLVRVINRGSADILSSFYDARDPVGLDISGGALIRADLSDASNAYLRRSAGATTVGGSITISPVILERDEWFLVKALVLHDIGTQPTISAHGKVAGQRDILAVSPAPVVEKEGFWHRALGGSIWIHLVRLPIYLMAAIAIVLGIVLPTESASEALRKRKRMNLLKRFKSVTKAPIDASDDFVFGGYTEFGPGYLQRILNAVADPEKLNIRVSTYEKDRTQRETSKDGKSSLDSMTERAVYLGYDSYSLGLRVDIDAMISNKFIVKSGGKWIVDERHLSVLTSFMEFLEMMGAKS